MTIAEPANPSLDEVLHAFSAARAELSDLESRALAMSERYAELQEQIGDARERVDDLRIKAVRLIEGGS